MNRDEVIAVVVSFNGLTKTLDTVRALRENVGHIVVVDNASNAPSLMLLKNLDDSRVSVIYLPQNYGIGHALNVGVATARQQGYKWMLTMDQDSVVEPDMIDQYCNALATMPELVCLTPNIIVHGNAVDCVTGPVAYAITSGNLVSLEIFDKIGLYNEDMFIDGVDFDFCLRVRKAGWKIYCISSARMRHELGEHHDSPALFGRFYTRHSPLRRYYMFRNYMYMVRKHFRHFPLFTIKTTVAHAILLALIPFYDDRPMTSLAYILRGIRDFFCGRSGKYIEEKK